MTKWSSEWDYDLESATEINIQWTGIVVGGGEPFGLAVLHPFMFFYTQFLTSLPNFRSLYVLWVHIDSRASFLSFQRCCQGQGSGGHRCPGVLFSYVISVSGLGLLSEAGGWRRVLLFSCPIDPGELGIPVPGVLWRTASVDFSQDDNLIHINYRLYQNTFLLVTYQGFKE
ncbi:hypothetical protein ACRRTK_001753 [Alexandromys fortis]